MFVLSFDNCSMESTQFQDGNIAVQSGIVGESLGEKEREEKAAAVREQKTAASSPNCNNDGHIIFLSSQLAPDQLSGSLRTPSPEYSDAVQEQEGMGETAARRKENEVSGRRGQT